MRWSSAVFKCFLPARQTRFHDARAELSQDGGRLSAAPCAQDTQGKSQPGNVKPLELEPGKTCSRTFGGWPGRCTGGVYALPSLLMPAAGRFLRGVEAGGAALESLPLAGGRVSPGSESRQFVKLSVCFVPFSTSALFLTIFKDILVF